MRAKLDENLGARVAAAFRNAGHDVATVADEQLQGAADRPLIDAARAAERCLVTLDVEFGNPLLFRPSEYRGIALLRPGAAMTPSALLRRAAAGKRVQQRAFASSDCRIDRPALSLFPIARGLRPVVFSERPVLVDRRP